MLTWILIAGILVKVDMLIILGPNKVDAYPAEQDDYKVKDAITKLLQNGLGLNVSADGPLIALDKSVDLDTPLVLIWKNFWEG